MSHMLDEIREQPAIVRDIITTRYKPVEALRDAIAQRDIRFAYIAGRGTSDNVARYAKYLLEIEHGIPTALGTPSVFTLYDAVPRFNAQSLVIGISQSGTSPDVRFVVEQARKTGALTAAITNAEDTDLAAAAEFPLATLAGRELSVAHTKAYTSALAILALLSTALSPDRPERLEHLRRTATTMERTLALDDAIRHLVARYKEMRDAIVIGRGYNVCTAHETALKITETCGIGARSFSSADFLRGPVAQVHEGIPMILFAPDGKTFQAMREFSAKMKDRHPAVIAFANDTDFLCGSETAIRVPGPVPEWLSPLVYAVAGQLFAHWLSVAMDYDPDRPRGLAVAAAR